LIGQQSKKIEGYHYMDLKKPEFDEAYINKI